MGADWPTQLAVPIEGATFSLAASHLPGAPREYRAGIHQGFDFFDGLSGRPLAADETIVAIADAEVVRIDHEYQDPSPEIHEFWTHNSNEAGFLGDFALDQLRGRQVWLRHVDGHISRYAHLAMVHPELHPGDRVEQGQAIGLMGRSGVPAEEETEPAPHLHFELWNSDGSRYFGQDLTPLEIHRLIARSFSDESLPRHARTVLASLEMGKPAPDEYPPSQLPETGFSIDIPDTFVTGSPFAVAVTWEEDDFRPDSLFAFLDHQPLGFIDSGDGAWLVGAIPMDTAGTVHNLMIGGTDQYGQTVHGAQPIEGESAGNGHAHMEVPSAIFERYSTENLNIEARVAGSAALESLLISDPMWTQAYNAPVEGDVERFFGQKIFHGIYRPNHPAPGVTILTEPDNIVQAVNSGMVSHIEPLPIRGTTVYIVHGGGIVSVYSNLNDVSIQVGERLERGQKIGTAGSSSTSELAKIGWEMHVSGIPTDPILWLDELLPGRP